MPDHDALPLPAAPLPGGEIPLRWDAESLWESLEPLLPGLSVEVLARCESTNTVLLDRARRSSGRNDTPITGPGEFDATVERSQRRGEPATPFGRRSDDTQPCLLVAEHQTRGRGRLGRLWQSSAGASLTFSLGLALQPADWSGMSLAVGVALADALDPAGQAIGLKWPNDLWLRDPAGSATLGRKLGGILIETVAVGRSRMVVVGVGLNVLPQALGELGSGYACLQELMPQVTAPQALHRVARPLAAALQQFARDGFGAFAERYARRDLLAGQPVTTTAPEVPQGVAEGVGADGALRVRAGEVLHSLSSGEVSVRLQGDERFASATPR
jgi:BirA family biotin operon repressor/biotin-[acetyl-CoA-carboxylase] ligase